jgi:hypothetical protein
LGIRRGIVSNDSKAAWYVVLECSSNNELLGGLMNVSADVAAVAALLLLLLLLLCLQVQQELEVIQLKKH